MITHTAWRLEQHDDSRKPYEPIDCPLDERPGSEEDIHDIEIHIDISSDSDESPVQRTDEDEDICQEMGATEFRNHIRHSTISKG